MTDGENRKRLSLDMPETTHNALKVHAAKQGKTMAAILLDLIEQELAKAKP